MPATKKHTLSIWFFVGLIFIIYGVVLMGAGIYYLFYPHTETLLYKLNPSLWWGAILLAIGIIFSCIDYRRRQVGP